MSAKETGLQTVSAVKMPAYGYIEMGQRTGIHMLDLPSGRRITDVKTAELKENEIVWKDCPDGVVFKRVGFVDPFNQPDSWLLDVAKFKAHGMGMTLCVKNIQEHASALISSSAKGYVHRQIQRSSERRISSRT